jgi:hypothetical protein
MKKILFPALLVVLGTGTAFATKMAKQTNKAIVPGYVMVPDGNGNFTVSKQVKTVVTFRQDLSVNCQTAPS